MRVVRARIVYLQRGWASGRITNVRVSKTGRTLWYGDRQLEAITGGYKASHIDRETGEHYWISNPRRDGQDTLYPGLVEIDPEVRATYWRDIRGIASTAASYRSLGVHGVHATR